jgi:hypothetical protein
VPLPVLTQLSMKTEVGSNPLLIYAIDKFMKYFNAGIDILLFWLLHCENCGHLSEIEDRRCLLQNSDNLIESKSNTGIVKLKEYNVCNW